MIKILISMLTALILCVGCVSSTPDEEKYTTDVFAMDTVMNITAYGPYAEDAVHTAINEIIRIENLFSTNITTSEIAMLNKHKTQSVSPETFALLETSIQLYEETNSAFNIAIFPIVKAWGFTTDSYQIPSDETLLELLPHTKVSDILLDSELFRVTLAPKMELGLGGIVKGYTSERIMELFKEHGITSGIVNLGGNVQVLGTKPDGSLWNIGIQDPLSPSSYIGFVSVQDKAVITSGPYERNFKENGTIYHHLIAPTTGRPAENTLASLTIISDNGTCADAFTKLFVLGLDDTIAYWQTHQDEFDMILATTENTIYITKNLQGHFTLQSEDYNLEVLH